nr:hypothetical protein CFP56_74165 [Quercus suber]
MDEDVKGGGSYAWQNILKARKEINLGSIWRIGDGKKVKIGGDKWLPDLTSSKVISPQKSLPIDTGVYAIINEDGLS